MIGNSFLSNFFKMDTNNRLFEISNRLDLGYNWLDELNDPWIVSFYPILLLYKGGSYPSHYVPLLLLSRVWYSWKIEFDSWDQSVLKFVFGSTS